MLPELHCSNFEDRAVLYAAGELSVAERALVDAHVRQCAGCAAILSSELELREALASRVQPADALDRSELLLAHCRSELFEALDDAAAQPKRAWYSAFLPWRWVTGLRHAFVFHPAWSAATMLILGLLAGTAGREWYRQTLLAGSRETGRHDLRARSDHPAGPRENRSGWNSRRAANRLG